MTRAPSPSSIAHSSTPSSPSRPTRNARPQPNPSKPPTPTDPQVLAQVDYVASHLDEMVAMSKPSTKPHLLQTHSYVNPGIHDPTSQSYNATKSVLPTNHVELFKQSIPFLNKKGKVTRWTKVGTGARAVYHRFQEHLPGVFHWNGSTSGVTKSGHPRGIPINDVPGALR